MNDEQTDTRDSVIEEMGRRILDWRHKTSHGIHQHDVERWARHLRDIVQPQLDELRQLKAQQHEARGAKKKAAGE